MILLSTTILALVALMAMCLPATWRIIADLLLSAARISGAVALTLESVPDTFRQMHERARSLTGERGAE